MVRDGRKKEHIELGAPPKNIFKKVTFRADIIATGRVNL